MILKCVLRVFHGVRPPRPIYEKNSQKIFDFMNDGLPK